LISTAALTTSIYNQWVWGSAIDCAITPQTEVRRPLGDLKPF